MGPTTSIDETRERVERMLGFARDYGFTFWIVENVESGELIGQCGLIPLEGTGPGIELGYRFASAQWGKGYATEAAAACRDIGFDDFGLERIYVDVDPQNEASQNVARKLGARRLGRAKHGGSDVVRFVIDRPD